MSSAISRREAGCKQRIRRRLRRRNWRAQPEPMFRGRNLHYEGSDRVRGLGAGGIGAIHLLARRT
ncbi:MAG: IS1380 family transposase, partial [Candidatus Eiseniibacteriota bacterium]